MRKTIVLGVLTPIVLCAWAFCVPTAHADYYNYPCNYPFVGTSADVDVIVHGGGQYCDGPTEINGTHYHCVSGGGGVGGGAIGLAPIGGLNLGAFGGSGVGGNMADCHFVCPDLFRPINGFPNPPAAWVKPLTVAPANNVCLPDHMSPAGPDGAPVPPADPAAPVGGPGQLPEGGRPHPPQQAPTGQPGQIQIPDEPPSPLTPGSPLP